MLTGQTMPCEGNYVDGTIKLRHLAIDCSLEGADSDSLIKGQYMGQQPYSTLTLVGFRTVRGRPLV